MSDGGPISHRQTAVHFLGVWDTVASVIVPGRLPWSRLRLEELPYTTSNPGVRTFRQAIAIDEFRRMFRKEPWAAGQKFRPNPFASGEPPDQDSKQVWFAGCHSDIGGGFPEDQSAISKLPLLWMVEQARAHGLRVRTAMVNHIVKGLPRKGARTYQKPDPQGPLHNSMGWYWWLVEWVPKNARRKEWPERKTWLGYYVPWAEPRYIESNAWIHSSVRDRMRANRAYKPLNVPPEPQIEGMNATLAKPTNASRRSARRRTTIENPGRRA